jgi:hypothetical protein
MVQETSYTGPKGSKQITTTIPAGGVLNTKSVAKSFYIRAATAPLLITAEGRLPAYYGEKTGETFEGEIPENLQINNDTGGDITFTIWFGFGSFLDGNAQVLGNVTVTALPATAATSANQVLEITALTAIHTDQATAAKQDAQTALLAGGLPAALEGGRLKVSRNAIGAPANAWNATVVGANATSGAIDTLDAANVSAFGHVSAATTITVQVSEDNITFYDTGSTSVLGGASDFHISLTSGAKYVRLKTLNAVTVTATISAK